MDLRSAVAAAMPQGRRELEDLVRIPSVSADGYDPATVRRSGEATAQILETCGLKAEMLEVPGTHPAVIGERPAPDGAPTVLLYAHHDVQPPGIAELWETPAFEPVERNGRLYGRGASDDKGGIAVHTTAIRAWGDDLPVGVKVIVEGEEEIGSVHLHEFLSAHGDRLLADCFILTDSGNWREGQPAITTSLRGLVDCVVEVQTLDHAVHSGMYGGVFPDALSVLARLLATLHDARGNVAVEGLPSADADPLDLGDDELRAQAGALDGVASIGDGSITARLWRKPSISVLAVDAPRIAEAANQLVPRARAKVSLRIPPGSDTAHAMDALVRHLESFAPWGAHVTVTPGSSGEPFDVDTSAPAFAALRGAFDEAWGVPTRYIGMGGTIPFVAAFGDRFPGVPILLTGVGDPDSRAHGENESVSLADLERACVGEALFFERFSAAAR
jgi:acetylornithine deacetylase/succinyl-diaminopimelate desuccinylase-like protein